MKMIGNGNQIRLNEATMIGVVQGWLDRSTTGTAPQVLGVAWFNSPSHHFVIDLEGENAPPVEKT